MLLHLAGSARAEDYQVGPGRTYTELTDLPALAPGDLVEVDGDHDYAGGVIFEGAGAEDNPVVIRGLRVGGQRPHLAGGSNTVEFRANHYVFEGFEITGGSSRCIYHHAHDITVRDTVVHDCPAHGILGADGESGDLTLEYVEVYRCGGGTQQHQIYMATNQADYPHAVFRMHHCYLHDANGGNNVKSRAERNEIYYNWIEGAFYHELELIGTDGSPDLYREDSDVACNVLRKSGSNSSFYVIRVGGDGTGETNGRYRFVNNTILLGASGGSAVFRLFDGIESIEMHNNLFAREGGSGGIDIYRDTEVSWASGDEVMTGTNNWILSGSDPVPADWSGTLTGSDPQLEDLAGFDLRPRETSPLVDHGATALPSPTGFPFPSPLSACAFMPPARQLEAAGSAIPRPAVGVIDIGAYEYGSGPPITPPDAGSGSGDGGSNPSEGGGNSNDGVNGGCGCQSGREGGGALSLLVVVGALAMARRRRGQARSSYDS